MIAVVVPFAVSFRRRQRHDRERKAEAAALGIDRPTAQFPYIDPALCIGCGACVAACPEGDVLGVVGGTATVINGLRCVGHARCEEACPVGAITVGLGDLKSRADMPQVDEWNETDTPGLFLAGEVRGLALVRNAIGQGRRVVERIAERAATQPAPRPRDVLDVVIVGAGPAGLSAALACRGARASPTWSWSRRRTSAARCSTTRGARWSSCSRSTCPCTAASTRRSTRRSTSWSSWRAWSASTGSTSASARRPPACGGDDGIFEVGDRRRHAPGARGDPGRWAAAARRASWASPARSCPR